MATVQADFQKLFANAALYAYEMDTGSTAANEIAWVDMRDYEGFAVLCFASALTGTGLATFTIKANSDSAGGGTDATIATRTGLTAADAVGDFYVLEVSAEQIASQQTSTTGKLRYVTAELTLNNAADEQVVFYVRHGARNAQADLTADYAA